MSRGTVTIFGYPISCRGINGDISYALDLLNFQKCGRYVACANPHSLVVASRDQDFAKALKNADILLPDGKGILVAAQALHSPIKQRVTGSDFFLGLTKVLSRDMGIRYFFLGSTEQVLLLITERMGKEFPNITVCGTLSPPFRSKFSDSENSQILSAIEAAHADVLWVGMTAPKQEKWIYQNRDKLHVQFIGAIGAAFDFYAGTKKRSSQFWQSIGLEWLPRFLSEPIRLWERNLRSTPIFLYWIIKEWTKIKTRP